MKASPMTDTISQLLAAFTPGDWRVESDDPCLFVCGGLPGEGVLIASINTSEADAQAISAVPDLIAVARMIVAGSEALGRSGRIADAARAALLKALGSEAARLPLTVEGSGTGKECAE